MSPDVGNRNDAGDKLTVAEVCAELQISESTFYYWRQTKTGPTCHRMPNGKLRVSRSDLDQWWNALKENAA